MFGEKFSGKIVKSLVYISHQSEKFDLRIFGLKKDIAVQNKNVKGQAEAGVVPSSSSVKVILSF